MTFCGAFLHSFPSCVLGPATVIPDWTLVAPVSPGKIVDHISLGFSSWTWVGYFRWHHS